MELNVYLLCSLSSDVTWGACSDLSLFLQLLLTPPPVLLQSCVGEQPSFYISTWSLVLQNPKDVSGFKANFLKWLSFVGVKSGNGFLPAHCHSHLLSQTPLFIPQSHPTHLDIQIYGNKSPASLCVGQRNLCWVLLAIRWREETKGVLHATAILTSVFFTAYFFRKNFIGV